MSSPDESKQFFEVAVRLSLLTEEQASELATETAARERSPYEIVSEKGLLTPVQLDILQTMMAPERIVPGYRIKDVIGVGGMGVIYRAEQLALGREVALKTVLLSQVGVPNIARRFQQEAQAVARLQHPHIVTAYDFGEQHGRFYFTMELVDGINADQYVKQKGPLDEGVALAIILQAISGLTQAYEHKIVHRDIKPSNLLLAHPPKGYPLPKNVPLVKIADFGLAFLAEQGEDRTRLTSENSTIGSPHYLAPEQLEHDTFDHRVDIYALGATLYHLVTGEAPFAAKSLNQILALKVAGKPRPVAELNPDVSSETIDFIDHMMALDPEERFSDYGDLWRRCAELMNRASPSGSHSDTILLGRGAYQTAVNQATTGNVLDDTVLIGAEPSISTNASKRKRRSIYAVTMVAAILVGWGGYSWYRTPRVAPVPQMLKLADNYLFLGKSLDGWQIEGGYVHPADGTEGEQFLVVEDGGIINTRLCDFLGGDNGSRENCPDHYMVELVADVAEAESALIVFAETAGEDHWAIRLNSTAKELLHVPASIERQREWIVLDSIASATMNEPAPVHLKLFRDQQYWFIYGDGRLWFVIPLDETKPQDEALLRLAALGGPVRFSDILAAELIAPEADATDTP
ncbi:MAG: hypothetical protein CMJ46_07725 [Planctomyces sp.]|nr:hypothetical protein [Planctomyces sp.]